MNMVLELWAEELRDASWQHIISVTLPDGQHQTTNKGICKEFCYYFLKFFTREPRSSSAQFKAYLFNLFWLEAVGCERHIIEDEIWKILKTAGTDETPGIDGLPYKVWLRLSHEFVPLLVTVYNNWMKQGTISKHVTRGIVSYFTRTNMAVMRLVIFTL